MEVLTMHSPSRRYLLVVAIFALWLGAAALACGWLARGAHPRVDELMLAARAQTAAPPASPDGAPRP